MAARWTHYPQVGCSIHPLRYNTRSSSIEGVDEARTKLRAAKRVQNQLERRAPKQSKATLDKKRVNDRAKRDVRRRLLAQFKSRPCVDCGGVFDPVCMDWDHLPGKSKLFTISRDALTRGLEDMLDEMVKCELVCSNCHRLRTKFRS